MLTINSTSNTKHGKNNSQHSCTIFFLRGELPFKHLQSLICISGTFKGFGELNHNSKTFKNHTNPNRNLESLRNVAR